VLDPIFERLFIFDTYACRVGKGTHRALRRAQDFARQAAFFLKGDVQQFFDSTDHGILKGLLRQKIKDERLLAVLDAIIDTPVPGAAPGKGLAIGNLTSQYFANFYLTPFDHFVKQELGVQRYLRYMDDFVSFDDRKDFLHGVRGEMTRFLRDRLRLDLNDRATYLAPVSEGLPFLGFRVFRSLRRLKHRNWIRFTRQMRAMDAGIAAGRFAEEDVLRSAQSLVGHIAAGNTLQLRRSFFREHDVG
jgi:hypothetical protein